MKKLTSAPDTFAGIADKAIRVAAMRKAQSPGVDPVRATAATITPARHGAAYEDPFAADMRAASARRNVVLDQIKAVHRPNSTPIDSLPLVGRK